MKQQALAFLIEHRATRVPELTERLVATIIDTTGSYVPRVPREELERSVRDNIHRVLDLLELELTDSTEDREPFYDAARATGARRALQGMALHDVLRSFRQGGRTIWDDLVVWGAEALDAEALREIGTRLWQVVDETSGRVADAYHETERSTLRVDEQRKAALWEGLLGGRATDPAFALEVARILDVPESGPLVVVAATSVDARPLESALGGAGLHSRWVRRANGYAALVGLGEGPVRGADALVDRTVAVLDEAAGPRDVVGVSPPVEDLARAHWAFDRASLAMQTRADRAGVAAFDAVLPDALLLSSAEVTQRLLDEWLGPVLVLPGPERRSLLQTLEAWVATGGSAVATAERVHCHRNTVINRLRRVADLTDHESVTSVPVPVELALAMRAVRMGWSR